MIFELDNVELYFKNKRILNGIYLKAETGKVTGLLGKNGCGKTSLLNVAFGNLNAKYKFIRVDNTPILKPLYKTGLVKYLPQHHFIPNGMRLKKVMMLFNLHWDTFITDFKEFTNFDNLKFKTLSGGQRRLLETYIILKSESKIVFLDEPFSHLAPLHIERVKTIIKEEKKSKAILITDHMYQHIIEASDSLYLLHNGGTKLINKLNELEDYNYLNIKSLN